MAEPIVRWVCTYCQASGVAESPEMARLTVDTHVSLFHTPARETVKVQPTSTAPDQPDVDDRPSERGVRRPQQPTGRRAAGSVRPGGLRRLLRRWKP